MPSKTSDKPTATTKLTVQRLFSDPHVHPYDAVTWETRDVVQTNRNTGETVFEQHGVEFPDFWSLNASTIVTTKYFRGKLGTAEREASLKTLIDRVVNTYTQAGISNGYFATEGDAKVFADELTWMLLHQHFSFNSPVWFNVGTAGTQQVSACFLLGVEDSMESILNWYVEEGMIFKGGSGAGINLSNIRSSKEMLSNGGTASGPISFMRGADASAGSIKSGGATRRAAKLVALDIDHPDIAEFIDLKVREEDKIRALRDAGFDMDLGGKDIISVQYQNANNSVQVSDEFMRAVVDDSSFGLRARTTGEVVETVQARDLFAQLSKAAWACADPGIQFSDTINSWHTIPAAGRITTSNPCSEFVSIDDHSCNLSSLNLLKFLTDDGKFDLTRFIHAVEIVLTAMDISVTFGEFPTEKITRNTKNYRPLGIGYANLGALLMASGRGYDSEGGRALAAAITSLMSAVAYNRSAEMAAAVGPYAGYAANADAHTRVVRRHQAATDDIRIVDGMVGEIVGAAADEWAQAVALGAVGGYRNCQVSLLAPTGTISFMMDTDTTGIEPDFSLVKFKKLVGGGSMQLVNNTVSRALTHLGYSDSAVEAVVDYVADNGHVVDAPGLKPEHYEVFDTAMGLRAIRPMGHVRMMAAVQPFLSGAISKTVNLPDTSTVEDIADVYLEAWRLGLKSVAVYRDGCKVGQPLSDAKAAPVDSTGSGEAQVETVERIVYRPLRRKLPKSRAARTTSFAVGGAEGYMTSGQHDDGTLGEVFLKLGKQGSTLAGVMDAFSIAVSIGLQYGVPLETFVAKFANQKFEPAGMTDDPDVRMAQSILDYTFRRLALDHLSFDDRAELGIYTASERARYVQTGSYEEDDVPDVELLTGSADDSVDQPKSAATSTADVMAKLTGLKVDAPLCLTCGTAMRPAGSCFCCESCGSTSGCS